jgi:cyanophycinase-like exopeptidase
MSTTNTTTTPAQWAAKLALIDELNINARLDELDGTVETIACKAKERQALADKVSQHRTAVEEAKALVLIGGTIDGKNAEIREAQLTTALRGDPAYQAALTALREAEREVSDTDVELGRLRSRETALKIRARLAAATLEMLAS